MSKGGIETTPGVLSFGPVLTIMNEAANYTNAPAQNIPRATNSEADCSSIICIRTMALIVIHVRAAGQAD